MIKETLEEIRAVEVLRRACFEGEDVVSAGARAEEIFTGTPIDDRSLELRSKCFHVGDDLFKTIGAQLSVSRHHAISWDRDAFLDSIDMPLNNRAWLLGQIADLSSCRNENDRRAALFRIVDRDHPGRGGFYDAFFRHDARMRLDLSDAWNADPGGRRRS